MKILIIAPDLGGVDAVGEVRRIQQWHDVAVLYGLVTVDDIYRAVQEKAYDVLHFATHGGPEGLALSNGVILRAEDIAQFIRLRETTGVFFSACNTGRIASYCVRHGARWAVSAEIARRPSTMSLIRERVTLMALASAYTLIPIGSRNSVRKISPGETGGNRSPLVTSPKSFCS